MAGSNMRDPLRLSSEELAELDERYPKEAPHENLEEAHFKEWVKTYERFEKRKLTEEELKLASWFWHKRGEDDYIAVSNSTFGLAGHDKARSAVLIVANKGYFSRSEASSKDSRPWGFYGLNP